MNDEMFRRVRCVIGEIKRCDDAAKALAAGEYSTFGDLMVGSHNALRSVYRLFCIYEYLNTFLRFITCKMYLFSETKLCIFLNFYSLFALSLLLSYFFRRLFFFFLINNYALFLNVFQSNVNNK